MSIAPESAEASPVQVRRRNAVLDGIEVMRHASIDRVPTMIAFLYLCENEGLCISELADLTGLNIATASRAAASLVDGAGDDGSGSPLARLEVMGRVRALTLTPAGARLRDAIDEIIARATMITPDAS